MKRFLMVVAILALTANCRQPASQQAVAAPESARLELEQLENDALAAMGAAGPVDFVDLVFHPLLCICSWRKGVLVDAAGVEFTFHVRGQLCPPGTTGLQWDCSVDCGYPSTDFVPEPHKNRAIGVLLGLWLTREFSDSQIASLPEFDHRCFSPFDKMNRGSFVLSLLKDPAMVDLPVIIALSVPNTSVPAGRNPSGLRPLNSSR